MDLKSSVDLRLDGGGDDDENEPFISQNSNHKRQASSFTNSVRYIAVIACWLVFGLGMYTLGVTRKSSARACFNEITYHSPIADNIDVSYHDALFDIPLFTDSIYVREPSQEVDLAWYEISAKAGGTISISESDLLRSGYTLRSARLPPSKGGGYRAGVEAFHLLHCLNFLRQATYFNVDYYRAQAALENSSNNASTIIPGSSPFTDPDGLVRAHLNHCIEALRQTLMCRASAEMYAQKHVRNFSRVLPAFKRPTKCANFESIREETMKRQILGVIDDEPMEGEYVWDEPNPMDYAEGRVDGWTKEGLYVGT
ncbi:MAG: hypothetical protein Q9160_002973 [Pyrenula sp. 1 TL-2023]